MTQAEQPVHNPDVTTSVKSSAHCGFSGGIHPPYSAERPGPVPPSCGTALRYGRAMPEILEVELYRGLAEKALHRRIEDISIVDSRYGRGGTTDRRLKGALIGHAFTAARR